MCEALVHLHADAKRLLLETDAPYLAKDPTEVYQVAKKASQLLKIPSQLLKIPLEEFISKCNQNASKFFGLILIIILTSLGEYDRLSIIQLQI
jgi:Tat protein secretion system quality control protein TatD with DNase activity